MKSLLFFLNISFFFLVQVHGQNTHQFAPLPYAYDALEPYIDAQTMETHYDKHHRSYYNNFLKAVQGTELEKTDILIIFGNISKLGNAIRNQGGGYWNHTFFWESMTPGGSELQEGEFSRLFSNSFGSKENFEKEFKESALSVFGSGWTWLILTSEKKLKIVNTTNQDNPYMDVVSDRGIPLLSVDVWEHAYYLKYRNKRADYITNYLKIVDWQKVSSRYNEAIKKI